MERNILDYFDVNSRDPKYFQKNVLLGLYK